MKWATRSTRKEQALRLMVHFYVGTRVLFRDRHFAVRGVSPMGASPRRVLLEDPETGELVEANVDDVEPAPSEDDETPGEALGSSG